MKNLFVLLLLAFSVYAQNIKVQSIEQITQPEQGQFFHPVASPKGQLLFTRAGYVGLYLLDNSGKIKTLSEEAGAGYEPIFSADGNFVYFRSYKYAGMKKFSSLVKKSVNTKTEEVLINNERDFTSARRLSDGTVAVIKNSDFFISDASQQIEKDGKPTLALFLEKGKLALYKNGEKKILTPQGDGFYLWPSLSPDGSKLLFCSVGQGTFITNIDGDILVELGYANAPQWSPDGKWVVFMRDFDDGHKLIESDIFIMSADGGTTIPITDTDDLKEVYPVWGVDNEIVFGSENGIIYKAILEVN